MHATSSAGADSRAPGARCAVGRAVAYTRAGVGHVPRQDGQYTRALSLGCTVFETFGGFSPDVCRLLKELADVRENQLSKAEYDDTTWAARTWQSWAAQQLSVAVQQAVAEEIAHALGIATA